MTHAVFDPDHMQGAVPGFHQAVRNGDMVFLAGQVAFDKDMQVVSGGLEEQTRQTLGNVAEVLSLTGYTPPDIVQLMIFYKQVDGLNIAQAVTDLAHMKEEILPGSAPVGFACSVHGLLMPELLVEVQAVAKASSPEGRGTEEEGR